MDKKGDKKAKSGSATKSTTTSMDSGDPSGIGPAINTQPQTPHPLQRTNTGSSSTYRDDNGKLSPTKILKEFGSNLKDIPLLPSTRNYSRPKSAAKPVGDVKIVSGVEASKPKVNLAKLPDIKIETGHPAQILVDWMLFTVPFDETNKQSSCWWYGGDKYTIKEWRDWPHHHAAYLTTFLPKKPGLPWTKKTLHVVFRVQSPMETLDDQVCKDIRTCLEMVLWTSEWIDLHVRLIPDGEVDPRLNNQEYIDMLSNWTRCMIMKIQDEDPRIAHFSGRARFRKERPDSKKFGDVEEIDSSIITRDFADGSSLVHGKPVQETMFENSDAELWAKNAFLAKFPTPKRHIYKGDERDDVILADPKR